MHLLTAITSHGYGHAAQVAPVLSRLGQQRPDIRLTVISSLPERFLRERIQCDFERIDEAPDFGLQMTSALAIDFDASAEAYRQLHAGWEQRVSEQAQRLRQLSPDLVLADVPYITLAASATAGIPAIALCSLNWADIYRHYFSARPEAAQILEQMESAYRSAAAFLCPEPSMPMAFLDNRETLEPIGMRGRQRRQELNKQLGITDDRLLILVAPGGVPARFPMESWPLDQGIHWLVSEDWKVDHPQVSGMHQPGFIIPDIVASCDAVLGKCGYGTVVECVVNATPLMYIPRPDWPEEKYLLDWLTRHDAALEVDPQRLNDGRFHESAARLMALKVRQREPQGATRATDYLLKELEGVCS